MFHRPVVRDWMFWVGLALGAVDFIWFEVASGHLDGSYGWPGRLFNIVGTAAFSLCGGLLFVSITFGCVRAYREGRAEARARWLARDLAA